MLIHGIKGSRHIDSKVVYRRMDALICEGWVAEKGKRPAKVQGESMLYELTLKGKAALKLDEISIDTLLETATADQLAKFIGL